MTVLRAVPKPTYKKLKNKTPKIKQPKISELKKDYDLIFSWWIRIKDCTANGCNKCYTCGKVLTVMELQCGHYWSRNNSILRFDERNAKPQCGICNCSIFGKGKPQEFALGLEIEYGGTILQDLESKKSESCKLKPYELIAEINHYTKLVREKLLKFSEIKISDRLQRFLDAKSCESCKQTSLVPDCTGCTVKIRQLEKKGKGKASTK